MVRQDASHNSVPIWNLVCHSLDHLHNYSIRVHCIRSGNDNTWIVWPRGPLYKISRWTSSILQTLLAYVFLFALEHCILFIYPCFRAASVTTGYTAMIKKVSNDEWQNIDPTDKEKFINYLKIQDCTFKISILCAKLSFGFYIAYFSIFVGILGVTLKLAL